MESAHASSRFGALACEALEFELALAPKPGLVTPVDRGSHADMDHRTFRASIAALRPYFVDCARLGARGAPFAALQARGLTAEGEMFAATGGVNTHKGAIFTLGLLVAAAAAEYAEAGAVDVAALGRVVRRRWASGLSQGPDARYTSNGVLALRLHGIPGAREHAAAGFPVLFAVTLPALRRAFERGADARRAGVHALVSTMAVLPDTNLVHRGGPSSLAWAQASSEDFVTAGSVFNADWEARLRGLAEEFVGRWLSPGGAADLLAAGWLLHRLGEAFPAVHEHECAVDAGAGLRV
ncbi:MAG: triphosphoribosyl-dephospho-CoA synthase [Burkholderiales bacterium]